MKKIALFICVISLWQCSASQVVDEAESVVQEYGDDEEVMRISPELCKDADLDPEQYRNLSDGEAVRAASYRYIIKHWKQCARMLRETAEANGRLAHNRKPATISDRISWMGWGSLLTIISAAIGIAL